MTKIKNSTVLITGAASGIGKLLAWACAKEGAHELILWDVNETLLYAEARALAEKGYSVAAYRVDVSDPEDIRKNAAMVQVEHGIVDIVFNNAGIVVGKRFEEHSHADIERTMKINASGPIHVARAFIGGMIEMPEAHIINISSAAGIIPTPGMTAYVASKFAVYGWSESLRLEMEEHHPHIHVTTVAPSFIKTGMFEGVKTPLGVNYLEPEDIVEKIIRAVKSNRPILQEPFLVKTIPFLRGILPVRVFDFTARKLGVYDAMNTFTGRKLPAS